ncbi:gasdermin Eb, partial [Silurus asotus]
MFAKATKGFVDEIDPDGCLIPVSRLNESDNLIVSSLVIKRNPFWFWQQPRYMPTDFTLNDVLLGEPPISPVVIETDFLKYNSTMENNTTGGAEAGIGPGSLNIEGKGSSKLASSFGSLMKQEVDLQKLLDDIKDRCLDFQHSLLKQTAQRRRDVFALVKERIITTQTCKVTEEVQEGGSCSAFLGFTVPKKIEVSPAGLHSILILHSDSNVFLEIPAKTALAYSLMELNLKKTGQFEVCLMPDTYGCIEVDGLNATSTALLYSTSFQSPLQNIQGELVHFERLSRLPASTRSSLFEQITVLLKDKTAISTLVFALEDLNCGRKSDLSMLDKVPNLKNAVQTTLDLIKEKEDLGDGPLERLTLENQSQPSALTAIHILTSALEEMTEFTLSAFESCCQRPTIQALHLLVQNVMENKECSLKDSTLAVVAEKDTYSKVQELFGSSDVVLYKEEDVIQAQISGQGGLSLILCIAIFGLASL